MKEEFYRHISRSAWNILDIYAQHLHLSDVELFYIKHPGEEMKQKHKGIYNFRMEYVYKYNHE